MEKNELYDWVPDKGSRSPDKPDLWRDDQGRTMFEYGRVDRLELEFNNTCFLYCGGCGRTYNPKIEASGKRIMSLEDIKRFFPPDFCKQLHWFLSCGNYGEPAAHPDALDILRWFRDNGTKNVSFSSNGSSRDPKFWKEAAEIINGPGGSKGNIKNYYGGRVTFSIDGLEDTNHLYRIGAKWDKLMANTEAFINAGGRARWQFITFNHNSHQLQRAKDMAKELGFSEFIEKMSFRFLPIRLGKRHAEQLADEAEMQMLKEKEKKVRDESDGLLDPNAGRVKQTDDVIKTDHKMVKKMGGVGEHTINIDDERKNRHPDREMLAGMRADGVKGVKGVDHFSKKHKIICQNRTEPRIYVSFDGKIWPCNWLGGIEYYEPDKNPYKQYWPIPSMVHHGPENGVPMDFNSLYTQDPNDPSPVKSILESPWYSHLLEEDWQRSDDPNGSLQPSKCKQMCHTELGTGIFEKMRRNEQNLVTGEYSDVSKTHGLTPPQGGSGFGEGSAMKVDESKLFKVNDIVASENYDDNSENKVVGEKDIRIYRYYKEVEPGKFITTQVDDERGYSKENTKTLDDTNKDDKK
jgi:MoaA/NifB/PqqE/SkfB family radical SAM enzyme